MLSSVVFHLDNNEVPVVYLDSIGVIVGGGVELRFWCLSIRLMGRDGLGLRLWER